MTFTLAVLLVLLVLFYTFQSLFTRMFSLNYAGPDASQSTSVFAICFGGFIGLATLVFRGFDFTPAWQTVLWGIANAFMLWLYNVSLIESGNRGSYAFLMIASMFGAIVVGIVGMIVDSVVVGATVVVGTVVVSDGFLLSAPRQALKERVSANTQAKMPNFFINYPPVI